MSVSTLCTTFCDVYTVTTAQDVYGAPTFSYALRLSNVPCRIRHLDGTETVRVGKEMVPGTHRFYFGTQLAIVETDIIIAQDVGSPIKQTFDVIHVAHMYGRHMQIDCREVGDILPRSEVEANSSSSSSDNSESSLSSDSSTPVSASSPSSLSSDSSTGNPRAYATIKYIVEGGLAISTLISDDVDLSLGELSLTMAPMTRSVVIESAIHMMRGNFVVAATIVATIGGVPNVAYDSTTDKKVILSNDIFVLEPGDKIKIKGALVL